MIRLYDSSDTPFTFFAAQAIPRPDVLEIEHRTFDGQFHLQQIGAAAKTVDVVIIVTAEEKATIDQHKAIGAPLKVTTDGRFYRGPMRGIPDVQRFTPGLYRAAFTLLVQTEGVI